MTSSKWAWAATTLYLLLITLACGPGAGVENKQEMEGTAAMAGASEYDRQARAFLPGYIGEKEMFRDDRLEFEVRNGVVTVRGTVDDEAERRALVERVRGVPGVRDVRAEGLNLGR